MRLNKYLSDSGYCSRREADRLIESGRVYINNMKANMGQKVYDGDIVSVDGKEIKSQDRFILIALNKPEGIECTTDRKNKDNIVDYVGMKERVFPIGRLDKNSCGLILLTNKGEISDKMMRGSNGHEKEYIVTVNKPITDDFIAKMSNGIHLIDKEHNIDTVTKKCKVYKINNYNFGIVLTQGINRQIRRMCKALSYNVMKLKRIRVMNIQLSKLPEGKYREVSDDEIKELFSKLGM